MSRRLSEIPKTVRMMEKRDKVRFEDKKQIFACECGKTYYAFPAIYLHFKRVHRMKISTRFTEELCFVYESESQRTFTYHYSESQRSKISQNGNIPREKNPLEQTLDQLDQEFTSTFGVESFILEISWKLRRAVIQKHKYKGKTITSKTVSELPLMFNDFVMSKEQKLREQNQYYETCEALLKISQWLNQKKYSQYILKSNLGMSPEKESE